ncbi:MAG TPA: DUF1801 domain-containing protein [Anaerolineales bacterium]|nr:DUF1801 domain-containing protein [Anaerolineales bacterium]
MQPKQTAPNTIDAYMEGFPADVQKILQKIRRTIKRAAPEAEEAISYNMPTFKLRGHYLIYFAAYKKHIALYPVPTGSKEFNAKVSAYQTGKGTLQFPLDQPIPYELITEIVEFGIRENLAKIETKRRKK